MTTTTPVSPILTYTSLYNNLLNYAQREGDTQFAEQIPFIIQMAQTRISYDLNVLGMEKIVEGTLPAQTETLLKPANWMSTVSISVFNPNNDGFCTTLQKRTTEFVQRLLASYLPDYSTPLYYSDNTYFDYLIAPIPLVPTPYKLIYHELLEPLSNQNQTNWITYRVPHLLMYAALRDSCVFFNSAKDEQWFGGLYKEALDAIQKQDILGKTDRTSNGKIN
jgi:hypothetical protein